VISLAVDGSKPQPFSIQLVVSGLRVGSLSGTVAIAESPTVRVLSFVTRMSVEVRC
jgi:hypothetical protein